MLEYHKHIENVIASVRALSNRTTGNFYTKSYKVQSTVELLFLLTNGNGFSKVGGGGEALCSF